MCRPEVRPEDGAAFNGSWSVWSVLVRFYLRAGLCLLWR